MTLQLRGKYTATFSKITFEQKQQIKKQATLYHTNALTESDLFSRR